MQKCYTCNKTSIITFTCECKKVFCIKHIKIEEHKCPNTISIRKSFAEKNKEQLINSSIKATSLLDRI